MRLLARHILYARMRTLASGFKCHPVESHLHMVQLTAQPTGALHKQLFYYKAHISSSSLKLYCCRVHNDQPDLMEPVGATTSIFTLLMLSEEIAGRGQILIRRYRGYPKALGEIRDRILQLEVQLSLLSDVRRNIRDAGFHSSDVGAQLSDTLSNTQRTFESIRDFLAQRSEEGGTCVRLRWARKDQAEVEKWIQKLTRHGHSLNVVLNILQVYVAI